MFVHIMEDEQEKLIIAILSNRASEVKYILEYNTNININKPYLELIPLIIAANLGFTEIVTLLLSHGADLSTTDAEGNTPLIVAVKNNKIDIVKIILDYKHDINVKNNAGCTALWAATSVGYRPEIVKLLLSHGADLSITDTKGRHTPLWNAVFRNYIDIVKIILNYKHDFNIKSNLGNTPLNVAAQNGYSEIVDLLINKKADLNITNNYGISPLIAALQNGNGDIIKMLSDAGADKTTYYSYFKRPAGLAHSDVSKNFVDLYNYNLIPTPPCDAAQLFKQREHPVCWVMSVLNVIILAPSIRKIFTEKILLFAETDCIITKTSPTKTSRSKDIKQDSCPIDVSNTSRFMKPLMCLLKLYTDDLDTQKKNRLNDNIDVVITSNQVGLEIVKKTFEKNPVKRLFSKFLAEKIGFIPVEVFINMREYCVSEFKYDVSRWFIGKMTEFVKMNSSNYDVVMIQNDNYGASFSTAAAALKNIIVKNKGTKQTTKTYVIPPETLLNNKYILQGAILWNPILAHFSTGFVCTATNNERNYYMYDTIHPYYHASKLNWHKQCFTDDCNVHIAIYTPRV